MINLRVTRTVVGKPTSFDVSELFETNTVDYLTGNPITHENFDDEDVFFIEDKGYTRESSLVASGVVEIEADYDQLDINSGLFFYAG